MLTPFVLPLQEQATLTTLLNQPTRHYHGIAHINDCLAELYKWYADHQGSGAVKPVTYAIWYHDVIYNPYAPAGVNEAQSAAIFSARHDGDWTLGIYDAIKRTAHHTQTQELSKLHVRIVPELMLDIDLAGLGKPYRVFCQNSFNIRKEYHATSDMDVVKGRLKFFQALNQRETFYYTDYFRDLYHAKSKENIKDEIDILEEAIENNDPDFYFKCLWDIIK